MSDQLRPTLIDLVRDLREHVGLFAGAMTITPREAWEQAIAEVDRLKLIVDNGWCGRCEERERWEKKTEDCDEHLDCEGVHRE